MNRTDLESEKRLIDLLSRLGSASPRSTEAAAAGRQKFLSEAAQIRRQISAPAPVSTFPFWRLNEWITFKFRKENKPMAIFAAVITALALLFGGGGAATYAAQDSQPGEGLYPVKTLTEQVRLAVTSGDSARFELALAFTERRMTELQVSLQAGREVPDSIPLRLEQHTQLALQAAAGMQDPTMVQALEQLRQRLETHERVLGEYQAGSAAQGSSALARVRQTIQERLRLVELGLVDPTAFRLQLKHGPGECPGGCTPEPVQDGSGPGPGPGNGPGEQQGPGECQGDCTPEPVQDGTGAGPGNGPGEQQGPGECQGDCTPDPVQDGSGPGPGPGNGSGEQQGPGECQGDCTPEPVQDGTGPGPGPGEQQGTGECQGDCTPEPVQDGTGPGPGPGNGPGEQQGPGECQGDCIPDPVQDGSGPGPGEQHEPGSGDGGSGGSHGGEGSGGGSGSGGGGGR